MGKAKWVVTGLIAVGATIYKLVQGHKEKDERFEKILKMTQIDQEKKEPEEKVEEAKTKTVEELVNDVDDALNGMDIDDGNSEEAAEETQVTDEQSVKQDREEFLKQEEAKRRKYFEEEWPEKVKKAAESKNFSKLEQLFDEKYAGGPWHPAPASVFGDARNDGVIDDKLYQAAAKYFDRLWCYSGD